MVSIPQSVWWMRTISSVPSLRCETDSERIMSSVTTPPALRSTCASPCRRPSAPKTSRRESMEGTIARRREGRTSRWRCSKEAAKAWLLAKSSSAFTPRAYVECCAMPDEIADARTRLVAELREHALVIGEGTPTRGAVAQYYVDANPGILRPAGFAALATLVAHHAREWGATAVGGLTMGADPVACA